MIDLLLSETRRSKYYLNYMLKNKVLIDSIFYYSKKTGEVIRLIKENNLTNKTYTFRTNSVNSSKIIKLLNKKKNKTIYSGYPGEIVKNKILLKKNLIHCHPGDLPMFKGSTTIFYSAIIKKKITVTCFRINNKIDEGEILYKKNFKIPKNKVFLNSTYDDKIRAETIIEFLKKGKKKYQFLKKNQNFDTYYVAHPIIRSIVINKKEISKVYLN